MRKPRVIKNRFKNRRSGVAGLKKQRKEAIKEKQNVEQKLENAIKRFPSNEQKVYEVESVKVNHRLKALNKVIDDEEALIKTIDNKEKLEDKITEEMDLSKLIDKLEAMDSGNDSDSSDSEDD